MKLKMTKFQTIFTICLGLLAVTTFILNAHYDWNLFSVFPFDTLTKTYTQTSGCGPWNILADNDIVDWNKQLVSVHLTAPYGAWNSCGISCGAAGQNTVITIGGEKVFESGTACYVTPDFGYSKEEKIISSSTFTIGGPISQGTLTATYIPKEIDYKGSCPKGYYLIMDKSKCALSCPTGYDTNDVSFTCTIVKTCENYGYVSSEQTGYDCTSKTVDNLSCYSCIPKKQCSDFGFSDTKSPEKEFNCNVKNIEGVTCYDCVEKNFGEKVWFNIVSFVNSIIGWFTT